MRFLAAFTIVAAVLASGCRYDPKKAPPLPGRAQSPESFVLDGEPGRISGSVDVSVTTGVPLLTVDVHGEEL